MMDLGPPHDVFLGFRHALRRSRVRAEILLALEAHGRMTLPDLARLTGAHPQNVERAIRGDGVRYRYDTSLWSLGLVDITDPDGADVYELTSIGRGVAWALRDQKQPDRGWRPIVWS